MNRDNHILWVEKYRPSTLDEYVFQDNALRTSIAKMVLDGTIPHLLFSGTQGSGKTTLARVIINEIEANEADVLVINASDEGRVDDLREKIKAFISTIAMGSFKIVHLEEADYLPHTSQAILRRMMEEYADEARFILTCNYEHKIIPAIKSRCQHFRFKSANKDDVVEFTTNILLQERVAFDIELVNKYVSTGYPDIRKIINLLQQNTINNRLMSLTTENEAGDYKFRLLELIEQDNWEEARALVCSQVGGEEWEDVYRFLYENIHHSPKFSLKEKWEGGIIVIADHLYKHSLVADPEINAAAMFIRFTQV